MAKLKNLNIDTGRNPIIYINKNSKLINDLGIHSLSKLKLYNNKNFVYGILHILEDNTLVKDDEIGVSKIAFKKLKLNENNNVEIEKVGHIDSFKNVIDKLNGIPFTEQGLFDVIKDVVDGKYTDMHIASLCSATAGNQLNDEEIGYFAKAMMNTGDVIKWNKDIVVDKHCIGGIPGNRTTPPCIAIVAEYGMYIPKTSSRAITSPSGTADTMEVLTNVNVPGNKMSKIIEKVNGCLIWGGGIDLSPSDDIIINVKKDLGLDSQGQMLASIMSKKAAAGSTHVLIDIPYGKTAKTKNLETATEMKKNFEKIAEKLNMKIYVTLTEGLEPIGNGVGPALEARDIVKVLKNEPDAPQDLKEKTIELSGIIIEFDPKVKKGEGAKIAKEILESGRAWERFKKICEAQGGLKEIPTAKFTKDVIADKDGKIVEFDNKKLSTLAKIAGCPTQKEAGFYLYKHLNVSIKKGEKILTVHSNTQGELDSAIEYAKNNELYIIK